MSDDWWSYPAWICEPFGNHPPPLLMAAAHDAEVHRVDRETNVTPEAVTAPDDPSPTTTP